MRERELKVKWHRRGLGIVCRRRRVCRDRIRDVGIGASGEITC
jgi:hypothetical protein